MADGRAGVLPADGRDHLSALAAEGLLSLEVLQAYVSAVVLVREIDSAMDDLFRDLGIDNREFEALVSIYHWGTKYRSPTSLAALLGMSGAGITALGNRLAAQGLLVRQPDPADGRAKLLQLTDEGQRVVDQALRRQVGWLNDQVRPGLSPEETLVLSGLLRRLVTQLLPRYEPPRARDGVRQSSN